MTGAFIPEEAMVRSLPSLARNTPAAPAAAAQRGDEADAAVVVHDRGRTLAEAGDQLARLVGNRVAGDRNARNLSVGIGEEYPLLRCAPPDGGVERRLAPVVGSQDHRHQLEAEAIEAAVEAHAFAGHGQRAQPDLLRSRGRRFRLRRPGLVPQPWRLTPAAARLRAAASELTQSTPAHSAPIATSAMPRRRPVEPRIELVGHDVRG